MPDQLSTERKKFPLIVWMGKWWQLNKRIFESLTKLSRYKAIAAKLVFALLAVGLTLLFFSAREAYEVAHAAESGGEAAVAAAAKLTDLEVARAKFPLIGKGIGAGLAILSFLFSLLARKGWRFGQAFFLMALWSASLAGLAAWLPTDVLTTQGTLEQRTVAGETPSQMAYFGKVFFIGFLILSPPIIAHLYTRLELMDRYVVDSFLGPFSFSMLSFFTIWLIFDFTDNGPDFNGLPSKWILQFYFVQIPFMILMVMPIGVLLALLFSLSKLSKSNEFITMIGAGRSVLRVLRPLLVAAIYITLIALAMKYEWGPRSMATADAVHESAKAERGYLARVNAAKDKGQPAPARPPKGVWAHTGWMHVNDYGSRTWFIGYVPFDLGAPMANVVIWKLGEETGQPETIWQARSAQWNWRPESQDWTLSDGRVLHYENGEGYPRVEPFKTLVLSGWNETPWKVLSSVADPELMGVQGLSTYLNANGEMSAQDLAPYRTHRWNVWTEPFVCLALALVAAPLGIVYSRKGVLGGVTAAIIIFAMWYIVRGTTLALGERNDMHPFWAAASGTIIVMGIGLVLLWYRSRNRELPSLKKLFS